MAKLNMTNLKKTLYYLQRNGLKETWISVRERLMEKDSDRYLFVPCTESELRMQSERQWENPVIFSIIVPLYRTPEEYLQRMIASVLQQSYPHWELILADATEDDSILQTLTRQGFLEVSGAALDPRIHYIHLEKNAGIAENTNQALPYATGGYIGLLDHDDVLTPDALYEMADAIARAHDNGVSPALLYSDEDKCNGDETRYYDPNRKEDFNYDLLLSNNYICHFLVMESALMKSLRFRPDYDGAQDYDLVLRAAASVLAENGIAGEARILHIPKVLYHWRCHEASTAANPHSKRYAYEAGLRALQDHADSRGIHAKAVETVHVGFYRLQYEDVLADRPDVVAVGGRILSGGTRGRITGGRMSRSGTVYYEGLPAEFGGYLHRAKLSQDAEALDLRCIRVRAEYRELFREVTGVSYRESIRREGEAPVFDVDSLPENADIRGLSLALSEKLREQGLRLLYLPEYPGKVEN